MPKIRRPDPAAQASKLPGPLQWPGGAIGQILTDVFGEVPTPTMTTPFITKGVPNKALREEHTQKFIQQFNEMLEDSGIPKDWWQGWAKTLAGKYPRITAALSPRKLEGAGRGRTGGVAATERLEIPGTDPAPGRGRIPMEIDVGDISHLLNPDELKLTVLEEMGHGSQALGMSTEFPQAYTSANRLVEMLKLDPQEANPFEMAAKRGARNRLDFPVGEPPNIPQTLKALGGMKAKPGTEAAEEAAKLRTITQRREAGGPKPPMPSAGAPVPSSARNTAQQARATERLLNQPPQTLSEWLSVLQDISPTVVRKAGEKRPGSVPSWDELDRLRDWYTSLPKAEQLKHSGLDLPAARKAYLRSTGQIK